MLYSKAASRLGSKLILDILCRYTPRLGLRSRLTSKIPAGFDQMELAKPGNRSSSCFPGPYCLSVCFCAHPRQFRADLANRGSARFLIRSFIVASNAYEFSLKGRPSFHTFPDTPFSRVFAVLNKMLPRFSPRSSTDTSSSVSKLVFFERKDFRGGYFENLSCGSKYY